MYDQTTSVELSHILHVNVEQKSVEFSPENFNLKIHWGSTFKLTPLEVI